MRDLLDNPPDWFDEGTIAELQQNYEGSLRSDEIANYIVENKDRLIPGFVPNSVICTVADDIQDMEEARGGVHFTGEELDNNIQLLLFDHLGRTAARMLENQQP